MRVNGVNWKVWGVGAFLATALLFAFSFPQHEVSEFAYFFAVPFLVWGSGCSNKKALFWAALATGWVAWVLTVFYLRHVSFVLPYVGGGYAGIYLGGWLFVASLVLRRMVDAKVWQRVIVLLGLAGFWIVLEWVRGWLFSGYPWLPLAASQWKTPVLLQIMEWTGAHGVSFILIYFNLAIASVVVRVMRTKRLGSCLELYLAIVFLVIGVIVFIGTFFERRDEVFAFRAGLMQPDIEPNLKWDEGFFWENLRILREETLELKQFNPDIVIWPESAVPSFLNYDTNMRLWLEGLVTEFGVPLLVGALAMEENEDCYNSIFEIVPEAGLTSVYCAKCKLVPFGEYVPFRNWLPFVTKVVPLDFDLVAGRNKEPMSVNIKGHEWKIGGLICYEDIFSALSRESVRRGAEFLLVITNDAWYHQEGGAYQHAANSVLRAVEVRRPVIRCGNNGWSGWIDEWGNIRGVLVNDEGSIYFRGGGVFPVYRDSLWSDKLTFYVRYGDWFVILSAFLMFLGVGVIIGKRKHEVSI